MKVPPDFVRGLPKAELHLHIEGTLEPELAFALARKHGITLPYSSVDALQAAYQFTDLQSFLDLYYAGADVLRDAEDFYLLTGAYLQRAHAQGVVHVEMFFDPQTHTTRGVPLESVIAGIVRASDEAQDRYGLTYRLIPCFVRHLSCAHALQTLEALRPYCSRITAVGLDSTEIGHPPEEFAPVFQRARELGLLTVAHAGEEGPASYIGDALDLLHVRRIDHGVHCDQDPALVRRLARERVPLTVCPLSNVKLHVFASLEQHNLKRLLVQGLCITVNSDDPAYFRGYILENYLAAQQALNLSAADLVQLARNSFEASFLSATEKHDWYEKLERYARQAQ